MSLFSLVIQLCEGAASVIAILLFLGIERQHFVRVLRMPMPRKRKAVVVLMVFLVGLSLSMSIYSFHHSLKSKAFTGIVAEETAKPYKFAWSGDHPPTHIVPNCWRANEVIPLDDYAYVNCTFINVTFIYNGTGPVDFTNNKIYGRPEMRSDNPAINAAFKIIGAFNGLRLPIIDRASGKPLIYHNTYSKQRPQSR